MAKGEVLTSKQAKFCEYYARGMSVAEAAIKAGYKESTAAVTGFQNLQKPLVKSKVEELKALVAKSLEITRERIARNILRIAEPDINDPTKKSDVLKANELLIKLYGLAEAEKKDVNITGVQVVTKDQEMSNLINSLKLK
jgi:phage terminase small subunit